MFYRPVRRSRATFNLKRFCICDQHDFLSLGATCQLHGEQNVPSEPQEKDDVQKD